MLRLSACALLAVLCVPVGPLVAQDDTEGVGSEEERGLVHRALAAFDGYTLICPLMSLRTVLLDMNGDVVHEWKSGLPPGNSVYLQDDGNLIRCSRITDRTFSGGGIGGLIEEYTWDGEVVWRYELADETQQQHHDIEPLPNGNILLIVWQRKSYDRSVDAGRDPELLQSGEFWPDAVYEIEKILPDGANVVWEWHVWDHLIQDHDPERKNYGDVAAHPELVDINADRATRRPPAADQKKEEEKMRQAGYLAGAASAAGGGRAGRNAREGRKGRNVRGADWLHTNGIDYNAELDQIVLSSPSLSELWVIDHSTTTEEAKGHSGGRSGKGGDLLYRYGNPQMYHAGGASDQRLFRQHDAQWIEPGLPGAGHLMCFNNGRQRPGEEFSTVDEIASPVNADGGYPIVAGSAFSPDGPIWSYGASEDQRFYSSFISGAQRLPNGNTLICSGAQGRLFEVTSAGEIVWDYLNEYGGDAPREEGRGPGGGVNPFALFRGTRIAPDHPGLSRLGVSGAGETR